MVFHKVPSNSGQASFRQRAKRFLLALAEEVVRRELVALLLKLFARLTD